MPPESARKFPSISIHNFFSLYSGPYLIRETAATPSSSPLRVWSTLFRLSQVATTATTTIHSVQEKLNSALFESTDRQLLMSSTWVKCLTEMSNLTHGTKLVKMAAIKVIQSLKKKRQIFFRFLFLKVFEKKIWLVIASNLFLSSQSILGLWEANERRTGAGREVCRHLVTGHKDWAQSINGKILTWLSSHLFETKHSQAAAAKLPSILLRSESSVEFPPVVVSWIFFFNETCGL